MVERGSFVRGFLSKNKKASRDCCKVMVHCFLLKRHPTSH